jgi:hypothetical protein
VAVHARQAQQRLGPDALQEPLRARVALFLEAWIYYKDHSPRCLPARHTAGREAVRWSAATPAAPGREDS